ncbi:MAG: diaminobutyrate--2-oxoglutarate transaminase family protein [Candidatus Paceibacterota bacterium]
MFESYHLSDKVKITTDHVPGPKSLDLLRKQDELESRNRSYPRGIPIAFGRAKGSILEDVDGNQYIDFISGCGVFNLGHNNKIITASLQKDDSMTQALDFPTEVKINFMQALSDALPESLRGKCKINFGGPTGSDAVESALKLARIVKHRHGIIAFQGSYHGMTVGALSVTSKLSHRKDVEPLIPGVNFMPFCSPYRCPFSSESNTCNGECLKYFRYCLENPHSGIDKPSAIIIEPVLGEGGTYIPTPGWLENVVDIAHKNGILVIFDEVQAGFYRTGKLFSFEHTKAVPDIVVVSKGIGGNGYPLSLIVYKSELDVWEPGTHIGTFRGNQVAMAAGLAALKFVKDFDVPGHVEKINKLISSSLERIKDNSQYIGDTRSIGMMFGIEYVRSKKGKDPYPEMAKFVKKLCYENGLITEIGGYYNNVIRFLPSLIITAKIAENGLKVFERANIEAERQV